MEFIKKEMLFNSPKIPIEMLNTLLIKKYVFYADILIPTIQQPFLGKMKILKNKVIFNRPNILRKLFNTLFKV